jgi:hypothetical protein
MTLGFLALVVGVAAVVIVAGVLWRYAARRSAGAWISSGDDGGGVADSADRVSPVGATSCDGVRCSLGASLAAVHRRWAAVWLPRPGTF